MYDSQFALNPIVTLIRDYTSPPIAGSLWRKFVKDGDTRRIKATTVHPPMPASWPAGDCLELDKVFAGCRPACPMARASAGCRRKPTWPARRKSNIRSAQFASTPETVVEINSKPTPPGKGRLIGLDLMARIMARSDWYRLKEMSWNRSMLGAKA
jgi:hypothetical protein